MTANLSEWFRSTFGGIVTITRTLIFANAIHEDDILRAALALREGAKK